MNLSIPNLQWNDLQHTKASKTGRLHLKITKNVLTNEKEIHELLKRFVKFYNDEVLQKIKSIDTFERASINEIHLLRNQGPLPEQKPHKDYEVVKNNYN